jgi:predicted secreted protein
MTYGSWVAMYFILWWLCLFVVLPFGAHSQSDAGEVIEGTEPGAPVFFRLWPRLVATSIVAGVLLVLVMWALANPTLRHYWS